MHDEHLHGRRDLDRFRVERAAVEEEGVAHEPPHRRELVEHAARHAARELLGFLGHERDVGRCEIERADGRRRERGATPSAALDESPAPIGSVLEIVASKPTGLRPRRPSTASVAPTVRPHAGSTPEGSSAPAAGALTVPGRSADHGATTRPSVRAANATRTSRSIAIGRHRPAW